MNCKHLRFSSLLTWGMSKFFEERFYLKMQKICTIKEMNK